MCSIAGVLIPPGINAHEARQIDLRFKDLMGAAASRGRDSFGVAAHQRDETTLAVREPRPAYWYDGHMVTARTATVLANCRAEPTTEYVRDKTQADVQPFTVGQWTITHNGTIANDRDLIERFGWHPATSVDSVVLAHLLDARFPDGVQTADQLARLLNEHVVGSYALAAVNRAQPWNLWIACNYKPVYLQSDLDTGAVFFSSLEDHFGGRPEVRLTERPVTALPAYSVSQLVITQDGELVIDTVPLRPEPNPRMLVVASGGLDSTVVAALVQTIGYAVTLLHFDYGCRATSRELDAVRAVGAKLGCPVMVVPLGDLFTRIIGASPLTDGRAVNTEGRGVAGAEFAHEWVPARNLVMLSIATAIAEAHGFDTIALGANLEESGAYPDNEEEFIARFDALLPYAVGPTRRVAVVAPLANRTKREIVERGLEVGAPMDCTWSCYHAGPEHCGECGPCFMRRTAFEMNGQTDPVFSRVPV